MRSYRAMKLDQLGDFQRTHRNGDLRLGHAGQTVRLLGWCRRVRNLGSLVFLDLRDRWGLVQLVANEETADPELLAKLKAVRSEFVLAAEGLVAERESKNPNMATGDIEIRLTGLRILNTAAPLPFPLEDEGVGEDLRLSYRFLDLRREELQRNMQLRSEVANLTRNHFRELDFIEFETPILTKSTPEGARDYLVPSRVHAGEFFALPQSPQLFKQLLQVAGFDRYYQITKCFRDEDLRADRQPEFTQVDIETSFLNEVQITEIMEDLLRTVFKEAIDADLPKPFPRLSYAEAMRRYGSDKPDLRVTLELTEVTDAVKDVSFKVFAGVANSANGRVAALRVPGGATMTRGETDAYTQFVAIYGAKGLAFIKVNDVTQPNETALQSPIVKNLHEAALKAIIERTGAQSGDLIFFCADKAKVVNDALGALRVKIGHEKGFVNGKAWEPLWVVDFPMFDYDEENKRWVACHHPFTSPKDEHLELLASDPGKCLAKAYDLSLIHISEPTRRTPISYAVFC